MNADNVGQTLSRGAAAADARVEVRTPFERARDARAVDPSR